MIGTTQDDEAKLASSSTTATSSSSSTCRTISVRGGALAVPRGDEIVPIVNRLAARFRNVVLTQDWHPRRTFVVRLGASGQDSRSRRSPRLTDRKCCGRIIACRARPARRFTTALQIPHAGARGAQGHATARSIPIRRSMRTTARRRPGSSAICASAASRGCSSPASRSIFASAIRPRTPAARASLSFVIEDACRGIDLDGSVAATHTSLAAIRPCLALTRENSAS